MTLRAAAEPVRIAAAATGPLGATLREAAPPGTGLTEIPLSTLCAPVLVSGSEEEVQHVIGCLFAQLHSAGIPWLRVGRSPARPRDTYGLMPVTLVDLAGKSTAAAANPLLPAPSYSAMTHAATLCDLFDAVFGLPGSFREVLMLALRKAYTVCGMTSADQVPRVPEVPTLERLDRAIVVATRELGYGAALEAALLGLVRARFGHLYEPASREHCKQHECHGKHENNEQPASPAGLAGLLRTNTDLVTGELTGASGRALFGGTIAIRAAEHACLSPLVTAGLPRNVLVIEEAGPLLQGSRSARKLGQLLNDAAAHGTGVILATTTEHEPAEHPVLDLHGHVPRAREARERARSRVRQALGVPVALPDAPGSSEAAWFRLWTTALGLAFLTGRPLPAPPPAVRTLAVRQPAAAEAALAGLTGRFVAERGAVLREFFPPATLGRALGGAATRLLTSQVAPASAGQVWVIPPLRWAHEASRVGWQREGTRPDDLAPPLDFALSGLPDWTGITAGQRLGLLLRHHAALTMPACRALAARVIYGGEDPATFTSALTTDLALVTDSSSLHRLTPQASCAPDKTAVSDRAGIGGTGGPGVSPGKALRSDPEGVAPRASTVPPALDPQALAEATGMMDRPGDWLVTVLRWPVNG
jgi:hypothetical protein